MCRWPIGGLESIGVDPQDRQNPETMFGLTYYYTAPKMAAKGTVTLKDRTVSFRRRRLVRTSVGQLPQTRYSIAISGPGSAFNQWRLHSASVSTTKAEVNFSESVNIITLGSAMVFMDGTTVSKRSYAFGPSIKVIPSKMWTSAPSRASPIPVVTCRLETALQGYLLNYEPTFPRQEGLFALGPGPYIEGVIQTCVEAPLTGGRLSPPALPRMIALTKPAAGWQRIPGPLAQRFTRSPAR